jgi:hypothetical protein
LGKAWWPGKLSLLAEGLAEDLLAVSEAGDLRDVGQGDSLDQGAASNAMCFKAIDFRGVEEVTPSSSARRTMACASCPMALL